MPRDSILGPDLHEKRLQAKRRLAKKLVKEKQAGFLEGLAAGWQGQSEEGLPANPETISGVLLGTVGRYAYEPVEAVQRLTRAMDKARQGRFENVNIARDVTLPLAEIGLMSSVVGKAPSGSLRTFAGRSAQRADDRALKRAQLLQAMGRPREQIWQETGWWEFAPGSGEWRFEIDDLGFDVSNLREGQAGRLADFVRHQKLFKEYPALREMRFEVRDLGKPSAQYFPGDRWQKPSITINPHRAKKASVLHEIQHAVQDAEGFQSGGQPGEIFSYASPKVQDIKRQQEKIIQYMKDNEISVLDDEYDMFNKRLGELEAQAERQARADSYRLLPGEAEARLTERRAQMGLNEKQKEPPWETMQKMLADEGLLEEGKTPEEILLSRER
jgi:hypothetical protein